MTDKRSWPTWLAPPLNESELADRLRRDPALAVTIATTMIGQDADMLADVATCLRDSTDVTRARAALRECFRGRISVIACALDELLSPEGLYEWHLELVRSRPGTPTSRASWRIEGHYKEEVAARGKYGAGKRVANKLKVSPATVNSVMQRVRKRNRK